MTADPGTPPPVDLPVRNIDELFDRLTDDYTAMQEALEDAERRLAATTTALAALFDILARGDQDIALEPARSAYERARALLAGVAPALTEPPAEFPDVWPTVTVLAPDGTERTVAGTLEWRPDADESDGSDA